MAPCFTGATESTSVRSICEAFWWGLEAFWNCRSFADRFCCWSSHHWRSILDTMGCLKPCVPVLKLQKPTPLRTCFWGRFDAKFWGRFDNDLMLHILRRRISSCSSRKPSQMFPSMKSTWLGNDGQEALSQQCNTSFWQIFYVNVFMNNVDRVLTWGIDYRSLIPS